jgi:hypothetical protein
VKLTKDHKDGKYGPLGNTPLLHELTLHCGMVVGMSTLLKLLVPKLFSLVKLQPMSDSRSGKKNKKSQAKK